MKRTEVQKALIDALRQVAEESGKPFRDIDSKTRPFSDLPDFDSLNCVELEVILSDRLKHRVEEILIPQGARSANVTVADWVDRICKIIPVEDT